MRIKLYYINEVKTNINSVHTKATKSLKRDILRRTLEGYKERREGPISPIATGERQTTHCMDQSKLSATSLQYPSKSRLLITRLYFGKQAFVAKGRGSVQNVVCVWVCHGRMFRAKDNKNA